MRGTNKLTQDVGGTPVVARAVDAALASGADPVVVVVGHEAAQVEAALSGRPVRFVHNPRWGEGMGTSVASGVTALADEVDGVLICLGDMPGVDTADLETLIHAFAPERGAAWVPLHRGKRGNPVLWAHRCFAQLRELGGDEGGRRLLAELGDQVVAVPGAGPGVLLDVDTRAALDEVRRGVAPGRPLA
jgi:molybdenum cofactor cytidylyltransferase